MKRDARVLNRVFCAFISLGLAFGLILPPSYSYALAPKSGLKQLLPSFFASQDGEEMTALVNFLADHLGKTPLEIQDAIDHQQIPENVLRPLLHQLAYLTDAHVLIKSEINRLGRQPAERAIKILLALAWQAEHSSPWKVTIAEQIPGAWDAIDLSGRAQIDQPPDDEITALLALTAPAVPFSMKNFFEHPLLARLNKDAVAQVRSMAGANPVLNNPQMLGVLTLLYFDPSYSWDFCHVLRSVTHSPGVEGLLKKLSGIKGQTHGDHSDRVGCVNELKSLRDHFLERGYSIKELSARIYEGTHEVGEIDAIVEKNGKWFLAEAKTLNMDFHYAAYEPGAVLTDKAQRDQFLRHMAREFDLKPAEAPKLDFTQPVENLIRRAWIITNMERKIRQIKKFADGGSLQSLFRKYKEESFGGIVFPITIGMDPGFEDMLLAAANALSREYDIPVHAQIRVSRGSLVAAGYKGQIEHPSRAKFTLPVSRHQPMRNALHARQGREQAQRMQEYLRQKTGKRLGLEAVRGLATHAGGPAQLTMLLKRHALDEMLRWNEASPAERAELFGQELLMPQNTFDYGLALATCMGSDIQNPLREISLQDVKGKAHQRPDVPPWNRFFEYWTAYTGRPSYAYFQQDAWDILEHQVWLVPKDQWPVNPKRLALHLADGRVLIQKEFYDGLGSADLQEMALAEEALFELQRRGIKRGWMLLAHFQRQNDALREELTRKAQEYIAVITAEKANKERSRKFLARLQRVEDRFRRMLDAIAAEKQAMLWMRQWVIGLETRIAGVGAMAGPQNQDWEQAMRGLAEVLRDMRAFQIAARHPFRNPGLWMMGRWEEELSLRPFLNAESRADIKRLVDALRKQVPLLNKKLRMVPAPGTGCSLFRVEDLDEFEDNLTRRSAGTLFNAYAKVSAEALNGIKRQLFMAIDASLMGMDIKEMPSDQMIQAVIHTKVYGSMAKDLKRLIQKGADEKQISLLLDALGPYWASDDPKEKLAAWFLYSQIIAASWGFDAMPVRSLAEMELSDIPVFRPFGEALHDLEELLDHVVAYSESHRQWTEHGFDAVDRERLGQFSARAMKLWQAMRDQSPFSLKELGSNSLVRDFETFMRNLAGLPHLDYTPDLDLALEKYDMPVERLKETMERRFYRDTSPMFQDFMKIATPVATLDAKPMQWHGHILERGAALLNNALLNLKGTSTKDLMARYEMLTRQSRGLNGKDRDANIIDRLATWCAIWGVERVEIEPHEGQKEYFVYPLYFQQYLDLKDVFDEIGDFLREGHLPARPETDNALDAGKNIDTCALAPQGQLAALQPEAAWRMIMGKLFVLLRRGQMDERGLVPGDARKTLESVLASGESPMTVDFDTLEILHDRLHKELVIIAQGKVGGNPYQVSARQGQWPDRPRMGISVSEAAWGTQQPEIDLCWVPLGPEIWNGVGLRINPSLQTRQNMGSGNFTAVFSVGNALLKIPKRLSLKGRKVHPYRDFLRGYLLAKKGWGSMGRGMSIVRNLEIPARQFNVSPIALYDLQIIRRGDMVVLPWCVWVDPSAEELMGRFKRLYADTVIRLDRMAFSTPDLAWLDDNFSYRAEGLTLVFSTLPLFVLPDKQSHEKARRILAQTDAAALALAAESTRKIQGLLGQYFKMRERQIALGLFNMDQSLEDYGHDPEEEVLEPFDFGMVTDDVAMVRKELPEFGAQVAHPVARLLGHWDDKNASMMQGIARELGELYRLEAAIAENSPDKQWGSKRDEAAPMPESLEFQNILEFVPAPAVDMAAMRKEQMDRMTAFIAGILFRDIVSKPYMSKDDELLMHECQEALEKGLQSQPWRGQVLTEGLLVHRRRVYVPIRSSGGAAIYQAFEIVFAPKEHVTGPIVAGDDALQLYVTAQAVSEEDAAKAREELVWLLLAKQNDPSPDIRLRAKTAFARLGRAAMPSMGVAAEATAQQPVEGLLAQIAGQDEDARLAGVLALKESGDSRAFLAFLSLLDPHKAKNPALREAAAQALGQWNRPDVVDRLSDALLEDPDYRVRMSAANALAQIADARAIKPLLSAFRNPGVWVKFRPEYMMAQYVYSDTERQGMIHALESLLMKAMASGSLEDSDIGPLCDVKDETMLPPTTRGIAMHALGTTKNPAVIPDIAKCILDHDLGNIAQDAILSVGKAGRETLRGLRANGILFKERNAVIDTLLIRLGDWEAVSAALKKLDPSPEEVRALAEYYLKYGRSEDVAQWLHAVDRRLSEEPQGWRWILMKISGAGEARSNLESVVEKTLRAIGRPELLVMTPQRHVNMIQADALRAADFDAPPGSARSLIGLLAPTQEMQAAKRREGNETRAFHSLIGERTSRNTLIKALAGEQDQGAKSSIIGALSEALKGEDGSIASFAAEVLRHMTSDGNDGTAYEIKRMLEEYALFNEFIRNCRSALHGEEYAAVAGMLNQIEDKYQVLEIAKILAEPGIMANLAEAMASTKHYDFRRGDLLILWLLEMANEEAVDEILQAGRPLLDGRLPEIRLVKHILHGFNMARLYSDQGKRQEAMGILTAELANAQSIRPAWTLLSSYDVPWQFKVLIVKTIRQLYEGKAEHKAEFLLSMRDERQLIPLDFEGASLRRPRPNVHYFTDAGEESL